MDILVIVGLIVFLVFLPIFREEIGIGLLHLVFSILTLNIFQLVMPFLYNKQYTSRMLTSAGNYQMKKL